MADPFLVVVGASAGGLQALVDICSQLPATTRAAIFVVVHTRTESDSFMPEILQRRCRIPVAFAEHGAPITPGTIAVAPPGYHLMVLGGTTVLSRGPKENGFRPAVDPLFRTAASNHGSAVMGVILSGALDDGSYGLKLVQDYGGVTVVQDPDEAGHRGMPTNALRVVEADHVLPAEDIGRLIAAGPASPRQAGAGMARRTHEPEPQDPAQETTVKDMTRAFGPPSALTCPDCGGALWEVVNGVLRRYRCHVGHQYTTEALDAEQQLAVEGALWTAVRILEERRDLRRRMAARARDQGMAGLVSGFSDSADECAQQADTIRALLFGRRPPATASAPRLRSKKVSTKGRSRPR